jgi:hypothetical protein
MHGTTMGLLAALNLPSRPQRGAPPTKAAPPPAPSSKAADKAKADVDAAWKDVVAFAQGIGDVPTRAALIGALKGVDAKRQEAAKSPDAQKQAALMQQALADIATAREAARQRSEKLGRDALAAQRHKLEHEYKERYDAHAKLVADQKRAADALKNPKPADRAKLEAAKADLDKKVDAAEFRRNESQAALEALADPTSDRAQHVKALPGLGAPGSVAAHTEVDEHANEGKLPGSKHVTTTTTSYADGKAVVEKTDEKRTIGLGSVTSSTSREKETTTAQGTFRTSKETTTKVGIDGYSKETKQVAELEHPDGTKLSVEQGSGTEIGKEGIKRTTSRTVTQADGSATSTSKTGSIDRGDGKLGVSGEATKTKTDAEGTERGRSGSAKGGITAADGSMGAYGEGKGGVTRQGKSGWKSGASLGLSASASCTIGDPEGDPPRYPVVVKVMVGAALTASGGHEKKGGQSKGSVEVSASKAFVYEQKHNLLESQLQAYVKALQAADKGNAVDATWKELQVLSVGVSQGWDEARKLLGGKASLGDSVGQEVGASASVGEKSSVGGKVDANVRAVKVGVSVKESDSHSTTATRNEKGGLDVESNVGHAVEGEGSLGVSMGVVSGSIGYSRALETAIGYLVTIEPAQDPKGEILKAFQAAETEAQQDAFIAKYKGGITVTGKRTSRKEREGESVELGVGATLALGSERGTEQEVETDADGRVKKSTVTGRNKSGGSLGVGDFKVGDSGSAEATSTRDEQGNVELEVTRTKAATNLKKLVRRTFGMEPEEDPDAKKKPKGALAALAGKAEPEDKDAEVQDLQRYGINVTAADLKKVAAVARKDPARWTACATRRQDYFEWRDVGQRIAKGGDEPQAVADALALFLGGGSGSRADVVEQLLRPSGDLSIGTRADFPESLKKLRAPYRTYVTEACEERIAETAKKQGQEAAGKLGQSMFDELEKLLQAITASTDFQHPAVQAEMISAINSRKTLVQKALRANSGTGGADADAKADHDEYARLLKECVHYQSLQEAPVARIKEMIGTRGQILVNKHFDEASKLIRQLEDLYAIWNRDWGKAEALGKKIGKPESHYGHYKPDLREFPKLKKACYM